MTSARPSIIAIIIAAYWDFSRVLRELWPLALVACLAFVIFQGAGFIVPLLVSRSLAAQFFLRQAIDVAGLFLLAPFLLAVHRFVLFGEVARGYAITPAVPRFQLFLGWVTALWLVAGIPSLLVADLHASGPIYYLERPPSIEAAEPFTVSVARIAVIVFLSRMLILLPAVAADAPGATWQHTMLDTQGNAFLIVVASMFALLPLFLVMAAIVSFLRLVIPGAPSIGALVPGVILLITLFMGLVMLSVIAARFYQALGNRLNQPLTTDHTIS